MRIRKQTFEEYFEYFKNFYNLDYIYSEIELWLKVKNLHGNFYKLIPSINEKHEGIPGKKNTLNDASLNQIIQIDEYREIYHEIDSTICKLNKQEHYMFNLIFIKNLNIGLFEKFDLIIAIAKRNQNFVYSDVIESSYLSLKESYKSNIKELLHIRKKELKKFIQLYPQFIPSEWDLSWMTGNGQKSRQRNMFIYATLFDDGYISKTYFEEIITSYHGGNKYYKFIQEQK